MIKPFKGDFRLSQSFGANPDMYAKYNYKGHNGMDWALPSGTEIIAPHAGKVIEAALDADGYGWYLKIENDKEGSVLGHNKELKVKVGDIVSEGQLIAISDNTGYSTGPHCHWGYYLLPRDRANGYGGFIDQSKLLTTPAVETKPTMTQEEQNIINFLKEKSATEGMVREAFGALADIPNMKKKLEDLETYQKDLSKTVDDLSLSIGQKDKDLASVTKDLKVIKAENQKALADVEYYKPYKGLYEKALLSQVDKYTAGQLISLGVKKLWETRKANKK